MRLSNRERSGVMVRDDAPCACWGRIALIEFRPAFDICVLGTGDDQENDGVGVRCGGWFLADCEVAFGAASQLESNAADELLELKFPFTKLSKSTSPPSPPLLVAKALGPVKDMKSSLPLEFPFEPARSCSFLDCSASTRADKLFINSMKAWNCCKFNKGPRLMLQRTGRTSIATKSASTTLPTCRSTFKDAIATAGSFVLIPFISGTIFSCIVYLSNAVEELFLFESEAPIPSSPSLLEAESLFPPQSTTKASSPLTLIPRLLVLLKTEAMIGKSSFLMVEKSITGRITGKLLNEASTMLWVGDSIARCIIGRMSAYQLDL